MTNEEAKALFEEDLKDGKCNDDCPECNARELAISALEKQIPKKVTHEATLYKCCTCPNCKNVVDEFTEFMGNRCRVTPTYCKYCSQALDWSEDK
ncbi:MAG: hypothetical protein U0M60_05770 [Clostridia bacterium]|nr:hypothetical protein [Clostridia bacterium]